jgi:hypothetical protein
VKKIVLFLLLTLILNSCNLYTVVVLDRIKPNSKNPYPIKDTTSNAVKFKFLGSDKEFWARDKKNNVFYNVGDTVDCYFKPNK